MCIRDSLEAPSSTLKTILLCSDKDVAFSVTVGDRHVSFQLFYVSLKFSIVNFCLFIRGSDFAGINYSNGGSSGYQYDAATIVIATNTPTTFSVSNDRRTIRNHHTSQAKQQTNSTVFAAYSNRVILRQQNRISQLLVCNLRNQSKSMKTYPTVVDISGFFTRFLRTPKLLKVWRNHFRVVGNFQISLDAKALINDGEGVLKRLPCGGVTRQLSSKANLRDLETEAKSRCDQDAD